MSRDGRAAGRATKDPVRGREERPDADEHTRAFAERIAAAPISWGVCEVPGWGHQLPAETVLAQMRAVGLAATELGPEGFLPDAAADKAATLSAYGLRAVAQFAPVVLHDPGHDPVPEVSAVIDGLIACGATVLVLAAATGRDGYDDRPVLDETGWRTLLGHLDRLAQLAADRGVVATLHPHVGTMVETGVETARVLAGSRIGLTLDTGHLLVGGTDPVDLAREHPDRITHVHLKDVRSALAGRVRDGQVTYYDAVAEGLYAPLGQGDIDLAAIVRSLEAEGYSGWYVLEQDVITSPDSVERPAADVRTSRAHLLALAESAARPARGAPGDLPHRVATRQQT